jgi:hypothetical protein
VDDEDGVEEKRVPRRGEGPELSTFEVCQPTVVESIGREKTEYGPQSEDDVLVPLSTE